MPITDEQFQSALDRIAALEVRVGIAPPEPIPVPTPTPVDPVPVAFGAKNVVTTKTFLSKPRPTTRGSDDGNTAVIDKINTVVDGIEVVSGGKFTNDRVIKDGKTGVIRHRVGETLDIAGTVFKINASLCTLSNIRVPVRTSGYFVYIRPGAKGFRLLNIDIQKGSEFEACIRFAGSNGSIERLTCISTGEGFDEKKTTTGIRGYTENAYFVPGLDEKPFEEKLANHGVTITDFYCEGVTNGINAMSRGDSGPLKGIVQLFNKTTKRPLEPTFEGDWDRVGVNHPNAMKCVEAYLAGKSAGQTREQIVDACIAAAGAFDKSPPDRKTSLENRDVSFGMRAYSRWMNGRMVRCSIEIQPGSEAEFDGVDLTDCKIKVEPVTPERGGFMPGSKNQDWDLPGDKPRPAPRGKFTNCTSNGVPLNTEWLTGEALKQAVA